MDLLTKTQHSNFTRRMVMIPWHDMLNMFKDYLNENDLPKDTQLLRVQYHSTEQGKMCFIVESKNFTNTNDLNVRFDLKKTFKVGG